MELLSRLKKDRVMRKKLLLTTLILFALSIGYQIPIPGINTEYLIILNAVLSNTSGSFLNALTGGSFSKMSFFALSVTPFITASIFLQLLTVVIPRLERLSKSGSVGTQKMERLTLLTTGVVALAESVGLSIGLGRNGLFNTYNIWVVCYATIVWTMGACFLVWIGQMITKKLVGNGISLILLFNVLSTLPKDILIVWERFAIHKQIVAKIITPVCLVLFFVFLFGYVVVLTNAEERLKITNSSKSGMRMSSANENILPLKLNMGGVMPIIFTSSIMSIPMMYTQIFGPVKNAKIAWLFNMLYQGNWFKREDLVMSLGVFVFVGLTFAFSFFYMKISFNAKEIANNLKKSGGVINGLRPGQPTSDYIEKEAKNLTVVGTAMLIVIALIPVVLGGFLSIEGLSFGGTTAIIIVGVLLELKTTLKAKTTAVSYKSLVRLKGGF